MSMSEAEPVLEDEVQEVQEEVKISNVSMVTLGGIKGYWIPTEQQIDGHQFLLISKWDTGLAKLVLSGKGLARHKKSETRTINVQWFDEMRARRHLAVLFAYTCHCIFVMTVTRVLYDSRFHDLYFCRCMDKEKMPTTCSSDRSRTNPGGQRALVTLKNHVWRGTTTNGWWGRDGSWWTCREWMENPWYNPRWRGVSVKEMFGWNGLRWS